MNNKRLWHFAWWVTGICVAFAVLLITVPDAGMEIGVVVVLLGILGLICTPFFSYLSIKYYLPKKARQRGAYWWHRDEADKAKAAEQPRWGVPWWLEAFVDSEHDGRGVPPVKQETGERWADRRYVELLAEEQANRVNPH